MIPEVTYYTEKINYGVLGISYCEKVVLNPTGRWRVLNDDGVVTLELEFTWKEQTGYKFYDTVVSKKFFGLIKVYKSTEEKIYITRTDFIPESKIKYKIIHPIQMCDKGIV